jgi:hypothetical protein
MRGNRRAPAGAPGGGPTNREAISVTLVSTADAPTTPQKRRSPATLVFVGNPRVMFDRSK